MQKTGMQKGIGITKEVLDAMPVEEREFWEDFLRQGKELIAVRESSGATKPFEPTEDLRKAYRIAIEKYHGEQYCQVQHLQTFFAF